MLSGITDDDQSVQVTEIPGAVADMGVGDLKKSMDGSLIPLQISKRQSLKPAGLEDACVNLKSRDKRTLGQRHVKIQTALVIFDFHTYETAVFSFLPVSVFIQIRNKTFICRQNGHFLFAVFYGSICEEEKRYDGGRKNDRRKEDR